LQIGDTENEKKYEKTNASDVPSFTNAVKGLTRLLRKPCWQDYEIDYVLTALATLLECK